MSYTQRFAMPRVGTLRRVLYAMALVAAPHSAPADEPPSKGADESQPAVVDLVVDPAPEPIPALKYQLLVPAESRVPGNAAPIYSRIVHERNDSWKKKLHDESDRFLEMPRDDFPPDEVGQFLADFRGATDQLSAAARRSNCDWEYVIEGQDPLFIMLSDAQFMRTYARLLALKARYELRSGDLSAAVGSLRDGLALGQHVANAPFLVNQLIGIAIGGVMLGEVDQFVEQPGAPNLYWALAALPRPLVSLRRGAATESGFLELKFPELAHLDDRTSLPDWQRLSQQLRAWAAQIAQMETGATAEKVKSIQADPPASKLADARAYLRDKQLRPAAEVEAMSDAEVEVRYTAALFRDIGDAWRKWFLVPYPQSLPEFSRRSQMLLEEAQRRELIPLISILTPVSGHLLAAQARIDRQVARLQTIEALRMHAAKAGKLPQTLDEVTVVPVPLDPVTGVPFQYTRDHDTAILDSPEANKLERELLRLPLRIRLREK
jgi:hypothetical protein